MDSLYDCEGPTAWASPPAVYSYSSLAQIEKCPRQWQLKRSRYGERDGFPSRPNPAAAEGDIVHRTLDLLHRELVVAGLPAIGSDRFRQVVAGVDLRTRVAELVREHEEALAAHPRSLGVGRLRLGNQELVNRVVRLFRDSYAGTGERAPGAGQDGAKAESSSVPLADLLEIRGVLSELELIHPALAFKGIVDLVYLEGEAIVVADFKSGSPQSEHEKQVLFYALLWWRASGACPSRIEVRYLGDTWSRSVGEDELSKGEELLEGEIQSAKKALDRPPARARLGEHCDFCPVRQFCGDYWEEQGGVPKQAGRSFDLELTVEALFDHGMEGTSRNGKTTAVAETHRVVDLSVGDRLRILGATATEKKDVVGIRPWTEIFRIARSSG